MQSRRARFNPWVEKIPWRRAWQPTPVFLPRKSHGHRSLVGCSSWDHEELDTTYALNTTNNKGLVVYKAFKKPRDLCRLILQIRK